MPKRTNRKQQLIEMLRKLLAPQGATVTTSKLLPFTSETPALTKVKREVDIVAEIEVDGQTFTQCFEVVGRSRPMDMTWVEQMIGKHERLPTDRLFLVSWSGFAKTALALALATPRVIPVSVRAERGSTRLVAEQVNLTLQRVKPTVVLPDGRATEMPPAPDDLALFSSSCEEKGTIKQLAMWLLKLPTIGQAMLEEAHRNPRRDEMKWFEAKLPLVDAPVNDLYLRNEDKNEMQRLIAVVLGGHFKFNSEPVDLTLQRQHNERSGTADGVFGHGEVALGGQRHLVVASIDGEQGATRVSVEPDKTANGSKRSATKPKRSPS